MKKIIILTAVLFLLINTSFSIQGKIKTESLNKSEFPNEIDNTFNRFQSIDDKLIGNMKVNYWDHVINGYQIKNDYILLQKNHQTNEIIKFEKEWRDIDLSTISFNLNDFEPENIFWKEKVIFLEKEDLGNFYTITEEQTYPFTCWEVRHTDGTTIMYDSNGNQVGYGIPTPSKGYSLHGIADWTGPYYDFDEWAFLRENAHYWFKKWTTTSATHSRPAHWQVSLKLKDDDLDFFYEIAHSPEKKPDNPNEASSRFLLSWTGDTSWFRASDVDEAFSNRENPIKFAYIGSCDGMTYTDEGSLSYAFRKGKMSNTATVGYTEMYNSQGWSSIEDWQDLMFQKMDEGLTIKDAFNIANAKYPKLEQYVKFVGDSSLRAAKSRNIENTPDSNRLKILTFIAEILNLNINNLIQHLNFNNQIFIIQ
jgi:hypothetical protein